MLVGLDNNNSKKSKKSARKNNKGNQQDGGSISVMNQSSSSLFSHSFVNHEEEKKTESLEMSVDLIRRDVGRSVIFRYKQQRLEDYVDDYDIEEESILKSNELQIIKKRAVTTAQHPL